MNNKTVPASPNTEGLAAFARVKASVTRKRVTEALDRLVAEGRSVNFNSVSREASVTKGYLYKQEDLRERICLLRDVPGGGKLRILTGGQLDQRRTEKTKDVLLAAKDKRIRELEGEVQRLKRDVQAAYGQAWDKI